LIAIRRGVGARHRDETGQSGEIDMISRETVLRALTIQQTGLSKWAKVCRRVNNLVGIAHPNYPLLTDAQLMSYVKRLLPEIRAMIAALEEETESSGAN
jgi:hypothetical protein